MSEREIIEMWDDIDDAIVHCVLYIASMAGHLEEDDEWLESRMYDYGMVGDIRENVVAMLEKLGYKFPIVEEV